MPSYVIKIDAMGVVTTEGVDFKGESCKDATKAVEDAVSRGGAVKTEYKDDWHEVDLEQVTHHTHEGS